MQKQIEQTLDSREVAEMVGKEHKNLMRDVRSYVEELGQLKIEPSDFFKESTYQRQGYLTNTDHYYTHWMIKSGLPVLLL